MRKLFFLVFCFWITKTIAQDTSLLTLDFCKTRIKSKYSLYSQADIQKRINELKVKNTTSTYLPNLTLNGQASWQSEVTGLPISIPGMKIPELAKDQYKAYLEVSQTLWDGGISGTQRNIEQINLLIENKNIDIQSYQLTDKINQLYFTALYLQKQEEILNIALNTLNERLKTAESGVKMGAVMPLQAKMMKAEILKTEQQLAEIQSNYKINKELLEILADTTFANPVKFTSPEIERKQKSENTFLRPELEFYELQKNKLTELTNLTGNKRMPRIGAFAQAGYGRPGLNMLNNEFSPYAIVGVKLTWNLVDWNNKRDREILKVQSELLDNQKSMVQTDLETRLKRSEENIYRIENLIIKDKEILEVRTDIVKIYTAQVDNGVAKTSDYITELNAETQAKMNLELHQIQLLQEKINYNLITGNE